MNHFSPAQEQQFRLITIPISHFCEKARWALTKLQVPYVEEPHMPPFHLMATNRVGGKTTPVLVTKEEVFTDSTEILKYLDKIAPVNAKLYPTNPELRRQVEELENLFDERLGPAIRLWGYFGVMNDQKLMRRNWCHNVPFVEQALFPVVFPFMQKLARQKFNINPESAAQAYEQIQSIFEKVSELLADGRNYLVGDQFSAADLTFAALAAGTVSPPEHPMKKPVETLPTKMVSDIKQFQATPAGAYVLRLYRELRTENYSGS
ncbi:MAG: glutathione S-transferase family protein [Rhizonema sp. PD37]|nr:glutathione S-transferase family protein [Rhizonema sp. PD37]